MKNAMKDSWKWVLGLLLLAVVAFGMTVPGLQAGLTASGKFNLPFDAQLGQMGLPTGNNYMLTVDGASIDGKIIVYQGTRAVGFLRPQWFSGYENQTKKPQLVCIRHDGNVTIRALRLPNVGTFYFSLPKELKVLMAQQPQLIETVSVEAAGD
jgi:hypothetical protein